MAGVGNNAERRVGEPFPLQELCVMIEGQVRDSIPGKELVKTVLQRLRDPAQKIGYLSPNRFEEEQRRMPVKWAA